MAFVVKALWRKLELSGGLKDSLGGRSDDVIVCCGSVVRKWNGMQSLCLRCCLLLWIYGWNCGGILDDSSGGVVEFPRILFQWWGPEVKVGEGLDGVTAELYSAVSWSCCLLKTATGKAWRKTKWKTGPRAALSEQELGRTGLVKASFAKQSG